MDAPLSITRSSPLPAIARTTTRTPPAMHGLRGQSSLSLLADHPGQTAHPESEQADRKAPPRTASLDLPDWKEHIHPNGVLYYHNATVRLTTNIDLRSAQGLVMLGEQRTIVDHVVALHGDWHIPTDWEVLIEKEGFTWIDHAREVASLMNQDPREFEISSPNSFDLRRTSRYWAFIQGYPCHSSVNEARYTEAFESLTWCYADRLLFGHSNATFSTSDSKELISILLSLQETKSSTRTWFIACILLAIYTDRYNTQWGLQEAFETRQRERQEITNLIEAHTWPSAFLFYVVGFLVFLGIPYSYFWRIQSVDRTRFKDGISTDRWRSFLSTILQEWRESNLVATVLVTQVACISGFPYLTLSSLSANVSFLAVPGLGETSRTLSLISTVSSMGSVCIGFFLSWKHQAKRQSSAEMGLRYFTRAKLTFHSSVPLALILSLPMVLLLWALLTFMAAVFTLAIFDDSEGKFASETSLSTTIALAVLAICALTAWIFFINVWAPLLPKHLDALYIYLKSALNQAERRAESLPIPVPTNTMRRYLHRADEDDLSTQYHGPHRDAILTRHTPHTLRKPEVPAVEALQRSGSAGGWSSDASVTPPGPGTPARGVQPKLYGSPPLLSRGLATVQDEAVRRDSPRIRPRQLAGVTASAPNSPAGRFLGSLPNLDRAPDAERALVQSSTLPDVVAQTDDKPGDAVTSDSTTQTNLQVPRGGPQSSNLSIVDEVSERSSRSNG